MTRKLVAIILAVLINCAVLAWFDTSTTAVVADAAVPQPTGEPVTLAAITVQPTHAQMEMLRREARSARAGSDAALRGTSAQVR